MCIFTLSCISYGVLMQGNALLSLKEEKIEALKIDGRHNKAGT